MKKELTPFGEAFERLRFERKQTLEEAAKSLLVSTTYLFAIIHGKRDIPFDFIRKMEIAYNLTPEEIDSFNDAFDKTPRLRQISFEELRAALINLVTNEATSEQEMERAIKQINEFLDPLKK